jgi:hypothetical protein
LKEKKKTVQRREFGRTWYELLVAAAATVAAGPIPSSPAVLPGPDVAFPPTQQKATAIWQKIHRYLKFF